MQVAFLGAFRERESAQAQAHLSGSTPTAARAAQPWDSKETPMIRIPHWIIYAALAGLYGAAGLGADKPALAFLMAVAYAFLAVARAG